MAAIRYAATFARQLEVQAIYLEDRGEADWADRMREDLDQMKQLLGRFPSAGLELARQKDVSLRKLKLRRCPFVVWYSIDASEGHVTFVRLFHSGQLTPEPRIP